MEISVIIDRIQNIFYTIINGNITNQVFLDLSYLIIFLAIIIFLISIIIRLIYLKRSKEEKIASEILKKISTGQKIVKKENVEKTNLIKDENSEIKNNELTLKDMLIKKFGPKIELQLHTKIKIIDFNASKDNFVAKIIVQGHNLQLVLDSSGKIIDYKNLDD